MKLLVNEPSRPGLRHAAGVSLIELMVALTIGLVMMGGAVTVYLKARDTYATSETTARLQETGRYALGIIESDVRMANFWGLNNRADFVTANGSSVFPVCSTITNWATDAVNYIGGNNNGYALPCAASGGGASTNTDVLISRHASATRLPAQDPATALPAANLDRVMIVSSRTAGQIFVPKDISNKVPSGYDTADKGTFPLAAETRQMLTSAYYVSQDSSVANGYPALRRKVLVAGPAIADEEVIPGVEDLQFQIGVDTTGDANADLFVNPGSVPAGGNPVSVRVWLLIRAQDIDVAHKDTQAYTYADQSVSAPNDMYRRVLISKTIQLRNVRP